jgi:hypothetical protein
MEKATANFPVSLAFEWRMEATRLRLDALKKDLKQHQSPEIALLRMRAETLEECAKQIEEMMDNDYAPIPSSKTTVLSGPQIAPNRR